MQNKTTPKFPIERKGYSKKDVDAFLDRSERQNKETIASLKEKIQSLSEENLELKKQVEAFKSKQDSISGALLLAGEKAKEQEILLFKKLKNEETRLGVFANKWTSFIAEQTSSKDVLSKRYQIEEYLKRAEEELSNELNKHFTFLPPLSVQEAQYVSEAKRLAKLNDVSFFDED